MDFRANFIFTLFVIASLVQGFKQQFVDSPNVSEGKVVEVQNKNISQYMKKANDGKDVVRNGKPDTIPIIDILGDMKKEMIDDRGISIGDKSQAIPSKDISKEIKKVAVVDSREIFDQASVEELPPVVDQVQLGQMNITKKPTQINQIDQLSPQTAITTSFKCDNVGRFAHPNNCEKYNFCFNKNETHRVFDCPQHQAFDPITQTCVHNFAACASAPKCNTGKRILPNVNDKSTYFECKFRHLSKSFVLRKRNCAAGREFDADLGFCKSKFINDDFPSDESNSSENMECEQVGIFTDHLNDFGYYECVVKSVSNGTLKLIRHSCPPYHMFIQSEQRCVPYLMM